MKTVIEPFRIRTVEPLRMTDRAEREAALEVAHYNLFGLRARDVLITKAIVSEEVIDQAEPAEDLLSLEGMTKELAFVLASKGVVTREDLAEQAVDDLEDIDDLEPELAAELIMAARAHWFDGEQQA